MGHVRRWTRHGLLCVGSGAPAMPPLFAIRATVEIVARGRRYIPWRTNTCNILHTFLLGRAGVGSLIWQLFRRQRGRLVYPRVSCGYCEGSQHRSLINSCLFRSFPSFVSCLLLITSRLHNIAPLRVAVDSSWLVCKTSSRRVSPVLSVFVLPSTTLLDHAAGVF